MPDIICGRCGTTLMLPFRRNRDVPALKRTCPTCNQEFLMEDVEPMARTKPGVIEILQAQLDAEAESKPAVLRKGPTKTKQEWGYKAAVIPVRLREPNPERISTITGEPRTVWKPPAIQTFG